jgi:hypothetical protein
VSNTTAAEKFDRIPPWTEIRPSGSKFWVHHTGRPYTCVDTAGAWDTSNAKDYPTEAAATAAARLTRPLDSWEPAEDCPLPVDDSFIARNGTGAFYISHLSGIWTKAGFRRHGNDPHNDVCFPTRRAAYIWAWTQATAPDAPGAKDADKLTMIEDRVRLIDKDASALYDRLDAVESILARITPEADSQVDGKGRTLVEIDALLDRTILNISSMRRVVDDEFAAHAARIDKLDRLIAAQVPAIAPGRSDAASANALATAVEGADVATLTRERDELREAVEVANATAEKLIRQLAAANESARVAEGRANAAKRHAVDAETKLADLRAEIERLKASLD